ncbi:unnamed protein product [Linum trigynum]|uniref:Uncharacterized protein n=1 Tax=Linum trigynum TaxID=586398 RepID=A0AAV2FSI9_9ROSI
MKTFFLISLTQKPDDLLESNLHEWYTTFLPKATSSLIPNQQRIVHSYHNVITGFAAKLTPQEAKAMELKEGFISARVERPVSLHTTFTPKFLDLQQNVGGWKSSHYGEGVIIGLIDTGIKHDHPSFLDKGMPPPPAKWRGRCDFNGKRTCNNKIVGARNFIWDVDAPVEDIPHGSHTASEPCRSRQCIWTSERDSHGDRAKSPLGNVKDAAIEEGVDVLTISMSYSNGSVPFFDDIFALGAFRAIQKGIFVSCSAGNGGPSPSTVTNATPWNLTVAASTIDREIRATVKLGNNVELYGQSLFQPKDFHSKLLPLVDSASNGESVAFCEKGSLKNIDVKGKIVICQASFPERRIFQGQEVKDNGGAGMILINGVEDGDTIIPDAHVLPASCLSYKDGLLVKGYLNSTSSPTVAISFQGTLIGKSKIAPQVASFSSRGPSLLSPGMLKPDIIGPGVNILAAWAESVDNATNLFNVVSGTSNGMPTSEWSSSSHQECSSELNVPATVFDMGSGHVDPSKALNPGLVYDIEPDDYISYLCGLGYNDKQVRTIVQRKANSRYMSVVVTWEGIIGVEVTPNEIEFKEVGEKASYSVTFTRLRNVATSNSSTTSFRQGSVVWSGHDDDGGKYVVTSNFAVVFV